MIHHQQKLHILAYCENAVPESDVTFEVEDTDHHLTCRTFYSTRYSVTKTEYDTTYAQNHNPQRAF